MGADCSVKLYNLYEGINILAGNGQEWQYYVSTIEESQLPYSL